MSEAYINVPPSDKIIEGGTINIYQNGVTYFKDMVTEEELEARLSELNTNVDLTGYATEDYVDEKIGNVDLSSIQSQIDALESQEMTYEKAVELGLNAEWISKDFYDGAAQQHRNELNEEFTNSALYYNNPSYTKDEFLFNYVKNVEAGLGEVSKFNSTIGYGQLPSLNWITPQDYIDWQNAIFAEKGQFNGNFVEYLYVKTEKQAEVIQQLEERIEALESK